MTKWCLSVAATLSLLAPGALLAGCTSASASAPAAGKAANQVDITITSEGFQPAEIQAKAGVPLHLVITRTTDRTCARQIVIRDLGVRRDLPLNQAVAIDITPKQTGQLRYACGMDMVSGVIIVK
jgi:plastocyanin domain-containing protein